MKIGILKDIKEGEYRVIATPCEVATLIDDGNEVFVQREAGSRAGFDDSEIASLTTPPLTTIHQPVKTLAEIAVASLLQRIRKPSLPPRTILLDAPIVVRAS